MDAIHVLLVRPPGYEHAEGLRELAETVKYGLHGLGFDSAIAYVGGAPSANVPDWSFYGDCPILVGAHLVSQEQVRLIPPDAVIYNTEQFADGYGMITQTYRDLLRTHQVWDVNRAPYEYVSKHRIKYVPVGYAPEMTRINAAIDKDIDVLFYGSMSPRRQAVLDDLRERGLNVVHLFGVYGAQRDQYISRAKVVLSMHYAEGGQFEQVRVAYALANRKAVVCEGTGLNNTLGRRPMCFVEAEMSLPYSQLAEVCERIVTSPPQVQKTWEMVGFDTISKLKETEILREALGLPA